MSLAIFRVWIGSELEQKVHSLQSAPQRGLHQRRPAANAGIIDFATFFAGTLDDLIMAFDRAIQFTPASSLPVNPYAEPSHSTITITWAISIGN